MSNLLVIGLCGKARSGKDTVAQQLVSEHGFFRIGLADGVRSAFSDLDGPTWELRKELESAGKTARWAAQTFGTECRLGLDPLHWITGVLIKIRYLSEYHPVKRTMFVISDVRFALEASTLKRFISRKGKFVLWKLERPGSGLTGDAAKHASEMELETIKSNQIIENISSLSDLRSVANYHATELLNARKAADQQ